MSNPALLQPFQLLLLVQLLRSMTVFQVVTELQSGQERRNTKNHQQSGQKAHFAAATADAPASSAAALHDPPSTSVTQVHSM